VRFAHQTSSQNLKTMGLQRIVVGMNTESRWLAMNNQLSLKTAQIALKIARIMKVQEALSLHLGSFHFSLYLACSQALSALTVVLSAVTIAVAVFGLEISLLA